MPRTATNTTTRCFYLNFPWEMRGAAVPLGAKWDADKRAFTYVGSQLPPMLKPFASEDFSWERWQEDEDNKSVLPVDLEPRPTMKPHPHQIEAAKKIVMSARKGYRGFLEADNIGVGKTISCLLGAYGVAKLKGYTADNPARMLIICPKSVMPHWSNTIKALSLKNLRVVVINYDRSKSLLTVPSSAANAKKTRTKNKHIANSGSSLVQWDIIIADESHKLKNISTSQRSKAFTRIARYAEESKTAPFVIWASGSAGQNPVELGYLAPLIGQMMKKSSLDTSQWGKFLEENGFHVVKNKVGYSWIKNDPQNPSSVIRDQQKQDIARMRRLLFSPQSPSIRRHPTDIAGWPEFQHVPVPVALDRQSTNLYEELWSSFRSFLKLQTRGRDPKGGLAQQLRFRQKASLLRVPGTVDFITDLIDNGLQVAVSVEFMESIDKMKEILDKQGITSVEFSGRNVAEREQERLKFQRGQAQVIFFTVTEGISLHAQEQLPDGSKASATPRATVVHDIKYSSLDLIQIGGRCHRSGQLAIIYYIYAQDTVEEKITKRSIERMAHTKDLSGDDEDSVREIETMLDNVAFNSP